MHFRILDFKMHGKYIVFKIPKNPMGLIKEVMTMPIYFPPNFLKFATKHKDI